MRRGLTKKLKVGEGTESEYGYSGVGTQQHAQIYQSVLASEPAHRYSRSSKGGKKLVFGLRRVLVTLNIGKAMSGSC